MIRRVWLILNKTKSKIKQKENVKKLMLKIRKTWFLRKLEGKSKVKQIRALSLFPVFYSCSDNSFFSLHAWIWYQYPLTLSLDLFRRILPWTLKSAIPWLSFYSVRRYSGSSECKAKPWRIGPLFLAAELPPEVELRPPN